MQDFTAKIREDYVHWNDRKPFVAYTNTYLQKGLDQNPIEWIPAEESEVRVSEQRIQKLLEEMRMREQALNVLIRTASASADNAQSQLANQYNVLYTAPLLLQPLTLSALSLGSRKGSARDRCAACRAAKTTRCSCRSVYRIRLTVSTSTQHALFRFSLLLLLYWIRCRKISSNRYSTFRYRQGERFCTKASLLSRVTL